MLGLKDKVAIVTGSTAGIGRGIALKLAAEGARVVINGRSEPPAAELVEEIRSAGGNAAFIAGDVLSLEEMRALAERTVAQFGRIDILVASAGGASPNRKPGEASGFFQNIEPAAVAQLVSDATLGKL